MLFEQEFVPTWTPRPEDHARDAILGIIPVQSIRGGALGRVREREAEAPEECRAVFHSSDSDDERLLLYHTVLGCLKRGALEVGTLRRRAPDEGPLAYAVRVYLEESAEYLVDTGLSFRIPVPAQDAPWVIVGMQVLLAVEAPGLREAGAREAPDPDAPLTGEERELFRSLSMRSTPRPEPKPGEALRPFVLRVWDELVRRSPDAAEDAAEEIRLRIARWMHVRAVGKQRRG
jgi:hypothetical protein